MQQEYCPYGALVRVAHPERSGLSIPEGAMTVSTVNLSRGRHGCYNGKMRAVKMGNILACNCLRGLL